MQDVLTIHGRYEFVCHDSNGVELWRDYIDNLVTTAGKNYALDQYLGTGNAIVGPYMGLISSTGYSTGVAVGDTMASHVWNEAGNANTPKYSGNRKTCVWSAASAGAKSLSAGLTFTCATTGGTVKGGFIVLGSGAVNTIDDTNGTLYSAGLFGAGDKILSVGDTVTVTYTASL